jgi:hypothetical protein
MESVMDHLRRLAWVSVARGCGFGTLAVFTAMIGLVMTPGIALDVGGLGFLLMAVILMVKADRSGTISHKRTEVWLMLHENERPPAEVASVVIRRVRRDVMLQFAYVSALAGFGCLVLAAGIQALGYR